MSADSESLTSRFQRVMFSVISTRVLLHVRGVVREERERGNDIALSVRLQQGGRKSFGVVLQ